MPAMLEQLVNVRSQLVEEVLAYLDALVVRTAELPPYYPAHLRTDEPGKTRFDDIRQMVQVVEDRTSPEAGGHRHMRSNYPTLLAPIPWDERAGACFRRTVILGDPGFGKTWLLRYEARHLALSAVKQLRDQKIDLDRVILPIFVRLPDVELSYGSMEEAIVGLTQQTLSEGLADGEPSEAFSRFVREKLKTNRCVILLDAWDEVPMEIPAEFRSSPHLPHPRQQLGGLLEKFARQFRRLRLLLTSRVFGYVASPIPGAQELRLLALEPSQIESFVQVWFGDDADTAQRLLTVTLRADPGGA